MLSRPFSGLIAVVLASSAATVCGAPFHLFDYGFNVEGAITLAPSVAPAGVDDSAFDYSTGLGMLKITVSGSGPHYVSVFLDHEIDGSLNSFFNEYGEPMNTPLASQAWEIDEPGYTFGNLLQNFQSWRLDNRAAVTSDNVDDVAMAMSWRLSLEAEQKGEATFLLSDQPPNSGFYLQHHDPDSKRSIFFSSRLNIRSVHHVPELVPTLGLMMFGVVSVVWFRRNGSWCQN
jgi:hypothetical protein